MGSSSSTSPSSSSTECSDLEMSTIRDQVAIPGRSMDTRSRKGSASTKDISLFDLPDVNKSLFIMNDVFDRDVETAGDRASGSSTPVVKPIHEISPPLSPDPN